MSAWSALLVDRITPLLDSLFDCSCFSLSSRVLLRLPLHFHKPLSGHMITFGPASLFHVEPSTVTCPTSLPCSVRFTVLCWNDSYLSNIPTIFCPVHCVMLEWQLPVQHLYHLLSGSLCYVGMTVTCTTSLPCSVRFTVLCWNDSYLSNIPTIFCPVHCVMLEWQLPVQHLYHVLSGSLCYVGMTVTCPTSLPWSVRFTVLCWNDSYLSNIPTIFCPVHCVMLEWQLPVQHLYHLLSGSLCYVGMTVTCPTSLPSSVRFTVLCWNDSYLSNVPTIFCPVHCVMLEWQLPVQRPYHLQSGSLCYVGMTVTCPTSLPCSVRFTVLCWTVNSYLSNVPTIFCPVHCVMLEWQLPVQHPYHLLSGSLCYVGMTVTCPTSLPCSVRFTVLCWNDSYLSNVPTMFCPVHCVMLEWQLPVQHPYHLLSGSLCYVGMTVTCPTSLPSSVRFTVLCWNDSYTSNISTIFCPVHCVMLEWQLPVQCPYHLLSGSLCYVGMTVTCPTSLPSSVRFTVLCWNDSYLSNISTMFCPVHCVMLEWQLPVQRPYDVLSGSLCYVEPSTVTCPTSLPCSVRFTVLCWTVNSYLSNISTIFCPVHCVMLEWQLPVQHLYHLLSGSLYYVGMTVTCPTPLPYSVRFTALCWNDSYLSSVPTMFCPVHCVMLNRQQLPVQRPYHLLSGSLCYVGMTVTCPTPLPSSVRFTVLCWNDSYLSNTPTIFCPVHCIMLEWQLPVQRPYHVLSGSLCYVGMTVTCPTSLQSSVRFTVLCWNDSYLSNVPIIFCPVHCVMLEWQLPVQHLYHVLSGSLCYVGMTVTCPTSLPSSVRFTVLCWNDSYLSNVPIIFCPVHCVMLEWQLPVQHLYHLLSGSLCYVGKTVTCPTPLPSSVRFTVLCWTVNSYLSNISTIFCPVHCVMLEWQLPVQRPYHLLSGSLCYVGMTVTCPTSLPSSVRFTVLCWKDSYLSNTPTIFCPVHCVMLNRQQLPVQHLYHLLSGSLCYVGMTVTCPTSLPSSVRFTVLCWNGSYLSNVPIIFCPVHCVMLEWQLPVQHLYHLLSGSLCYVGKTVTCPTPLPSSVRFTVLCWTVNSYLSNISTIFCPVHCVMLEWQLPVQRPYHLLSGSLCYVGMTVTCPTSLPSSVRFTVLCWNDSYLSNIPTIFCPVHCVMLEWQLPVQHLYHLLSGSLCYVEPSTVTCPTSLPSYVRFTVLCWNDSYLSNISTIFCPVHCVMLNRQQLPVQHLYHLLSGSLCYVGMTVTCPTPLPSSVRFTVLCWNDSYLSNTPTIFCPVHCVMLEWQLPVQHLYHLLSGSLCYVEPSTVTCPTSLPSSVRFTVLCWNDSYLSNIPTMFCPVHCVMLEWQLPVQRPYHVLSGSLCYVGMTVTCPTSLSSSVRFTVLCWNDSYLSNTPTIFCPVHCIMLEWQLPVQHPYHVLSGSLCYVEPSTVTCPTPLPCSVRFTVLCWNDSYLSNTPTIFCPVHCIMLEWQLPVQHPYHVLSGSLCYVEPSTVTCPTSLPCSVRFTVLCWNDSYLSNTPTIFCPVHCVMLNRQQLPVQHPYHLLSGSLCYVGMTVTCPTSLPSSVRFTVLCWNDSYLSNISTMFCPVHCIMLEWQLPVQHPYHLLSGSLCYVGMTVTCPTSLPCSVRFTVLCWNDSYLSSVPIMFCPVHCVMLEWQLPVQRPYHLLSGSLCYVGMTVTCPTPLPSSVRFTVLCWNDTYLSNTPTMFCPVHCVMLNRQQLPVQRPYHVLSGSLCYVGMTVTCPTSLPSSVRFTVLCWNDSYLSNTPTISCPVHCVMLEWQLPVQRPYHLLSGSLYYVGMTVTCPTYLPCSVRFTVLCWNDSYLSNVPTMFCPVHCIMLEWQLPVQHLYHVLSGSLCYVGMTVTCPTSLPSSVRFTVLCWNDSYLSNIPTISCPVHCVMLNRQQLPVQRPYHLLSGSLCYVGMTVTCPTSLPSSVRFTVLCWNDSYLSNIPTIFCPVHCVMLEWQLPVQHLYHVLSGSLYYVGMTVTCPTSLPSSVRFTVLCWNDSYLSNVPTMFCPVHCVMLEWQLPVQRPYHVLSGSLCYVGMTVTCPTSLSSSVRFTVLCRNDSYLSNTPTIFCPVHCIMLEWHLPVQHPYHVLSGSLCYVEPSTVTCPTSLPCSVRFTVLCWNDSYLSNIPTIFCPVHCVMLEWQLPVQHPYHLLSGSLCYVGMTVTCPTSLSSSVRFTVLCWNDSYLSNISTMFCPVHCVMLEWQLPVQRPYHVLSGSLYYVGMTVTCPTSLPCSVRFTVLCWNDSYLSNIPTIFCPVHCIMLEWQLPVQHPYHLLSGSLCYVEPSTVTCPTSLSSSVRFTVLCWNDSYLSNISTMFCPVDCVMLNRQQLPVQRPYHLLSGSLCYVGMTVTCPTSLPCSVRFTVLCWNDSYLSNIPTIFCPVHCVMLEWQLPVQHPYHLLSGSVYYVGMTVTCPTSLPSSVRFTVLCWNDSYLSNVPTIFCPVHCIMLNRQQLPVQRPYHLLSGSLCYVEPSTVTCPTSLPSSVRFTVLCWNDSYLSNIPTIFCPVHCVMLEWQLPVQHPYHLLSGSLCYVGMTVTCPTSLPSSVRFTVLCWKDSYLSNTPTIFCPVHCVMLNRQQLPVQHLYHLLSGSLCYVGMTVTCPTSLPSSVRFTVLCWNGSYLSNVPIIFCPVHCVMLEWQLPVQHLYHLLSGSLCYVGKTVTCPTPLPSSVRFTVLCWTVNSYLSNISTIFCPVHCVMLEWQLPVQRPYHLLSGSLCYVGMTVTCPTSLPSSVRFTVLCWNDSYLSNIPTIFCPVHCVMLEWQLPVQHLYHLLSGSLCYVEPSTVTCPTSLPSSVRFTVLCWNDSYLSNISTIFCPVHCVMLNRQQLPVQHLYHLLSGSLCYVGMTVTCPTPLPSSVRFTVLCWNDSYLSNTPTIFCPVHCVMLEWQLPVQHLYHLLSGSLCYVEPSTVTCPTSLPSSVRFTVLCWNDSYLSNIPTMFCPVHCVMLEWQLPVQRPYHVLSGSLCYVGMTVTCPTSLSSSVRFTVLCWNDSYLSNTPTIFCPVHCIMLEWQLPVQHPYHVLSGSLCYFEPSTVTCPTPLPCSVRFTVLCWNDSYLSNTPTIFCPVHCIMLEWQLPVQHPYHVLSGSLCYVEPSTVTCPTSLPCSVRFTVLCWNDSYLSNTPTIFCPVHCVMLNRQQLPVQHPYHLLSGSLCYVGMTVTCPTSLPSSVRFTVLCWNDSYLSNISTMFFPVHCIMLEWQLPVQHPYHLLSGSLCYVGMTVTCPTSLPSPVRFSVLCWNDSYLSNIPTIFCPVHCVMLEWQLPVQRPYNLLSGSLYYVEPSTVTCPTSLPSSVRFTVLCWTVNSYLSNNPTIFCPIHCVMLEWQLPVQHPYHLLSGSLCYVGMTVTCPTSLPSSVRFTVLCWNDSYLSNVPTMFCPVHCVMLNRQQLPVQRPYHLLSGSLCYVGMTVTCPTSLPCSVRFTVLCWNDSYLSNIPTIFCPVHCVMLEWQLPVQRPYHVLSGSLCYVGMTVTCPASLSCSVRFTVLCWNDSYLSNVPIIFCPVHCVMLEWQLPVQHPYHVLSGSLCYVEPSTVTCPTSLPCSVRFTVLCWNDSYLSNIPTIFCPVHCVMLEWQLPVQHPYHLLSGSLCYVGMTVTCPTSLSYSVRFTVLCWNDSYLSNISTMFCPVHCIMLEWQLPVQHIYHVLFGSLCYVGMTVTCPTSLPCSVRFTVLCLNDSYLSNISTMFCPVHCVMLEWQLPVQHPYHLLSGSLCYVGMTVTCPTSLPCSVRFTVLCWNDSYLSNVPTIFSPVHCVMLEWQLPVQHLYHVLSGSLYYVGMTVTCPTSLPSPVRFTVLCWTVNSYLSNVPIIFCPVHCVMLEWQLPVQHLYHLQSGSLCYVGMTVTCPTSLPCSVRFTVLCWTVNSYLSNVPIIFCPVHCVMLEWQLPVQHPYHLLSGSLCYVEPSTVTCPTSLPSSVRFTVLCWNDCYLSNIPTIFCPVHCVMLEWQLPVQRPYHLLSGSLCYVGMTVTCPTSLPCSVRFTVLCWNDSYLSNISTMFCPVHCIMLEWQLPVQHPYHLLSGSLCYVGMTVTCPTSLPCSVRFTVLCWKDSYLSNIPTIFCPVHCVMLEWQLPVQHPYHVLSGSLYYVGMTVTCPTSLPSSVRFTVLCWNDSYLSNISTMFCPVHCIMLEWQLPVQHPYHLLSGSLCYVGMTVTCPTPLPCSVRFTVLCWNDSYLSNVPTIFCPVHCVMLEWQLPVQRPYHLLSGSLCYVGMTVTCPTSLPCSVRFTVLCWNDSYLSNTPTIFCPVHCVMLEWQLPVQRPYHVLSGSLCYVGMTVFTLGLSLPYLTPHFPSIYHWCINPV